MRTDIFVRTRTRNQIRLSLAIACIERLLLLDGARVRVIAADAFDLPEGIWTGQRSLWAEADRYHINSREVAQEHAESDVYVVIDDDCMPIGKDWLTRGLATMTAFPEFSALASWSINGEIDPARCALPGRDLDGADSGIFEVPSLGTPTFIRRLRPNGERIELRIPEGDLGQYDHTLSQAYLEHGRIGMLRNVRHNHLGYGLSEVVPEWWLA